MLVNKNRLKRIILSFLVVYAINATEVLVVGAESNKTILNFVSKLAYSISTVNIVDILSLVGIYLLISVAFEEKQTKIDIAGGVSAVILAFLYIWCFSYKLTEDTSELFANSYQTFITAFRFLGYSVLFYTLIEGLYKLLDMAAISKNPSNEKRIFAVSTLVIFVGWLFWIVMAFPGTVAGDGVTQLGQYYFKAVSAHHPPLSTCIIGVLFDIGSTLANDGRYGVFLYLLVQALCGALIIGYSISVMIRIGISQKICYLSVFFLAFTPIFGIFAQWYEKDLMYSLFTLLFLTKLISMCLEKDNTTMKDCIVLTLEGLLCIFLRNNGIYAVIPAMVVYAVWKKERVVRRLMLGCSVLSIIIAIVVNGPVFSLMGIEKTNIREALSIPMQQSARYIKEYGNEVTEEEKIVLECFFNDYDNIPSIYEAYCADSVKNTVFVEKEELGKYFLTWFKMGLKHPGVYFDAFMCLNYGYLAPTEQNAEANGDMPNQEKEVIMSQLYDMGVDGTQDENNVQILKYLIFMNMVFPIVRYLSMPGIYLWMTIIVAALFIKLKRRDGYVILIPNVINLLVCLASPLCNGMRYELPVVLSMPIILAVASLFMHEKKALVVEN